MDMTLTAIVIIVAGIVVAGVGVALSARTSRSAFREDDGATRSDISVAIAVFGIAAMLFGAGYLGFLLLQD